MTRFAQLPQRRRPPSWRLGSVLGVIVTFVSQQPVVVEGDTVEFFSDLVDGLGGESMASLTNTNIHEAVALWQSDEGSARQRYGHISDWDTSECTDFARLFHGALSFDEDLGSWDTSGVTNMQHMFQGAMVFRGTNLGNWDVSRVRFMNDMFHGARLFSPPSLANWDTQQVESMVSMFNGAATFNGEIGSWDVRNVRDTTRMFSGATAFDQNVGAWRIESSLQVMDHMFSFATSFRGIGLEEWTTDRVLTMDGLFQNAVSLQADLSSWETGNVRYMAEMFESTTRFNSDISSWDTSRVTSFFEMFRDATAFNQNLNPWDVSSAIDMTRMFFGATAFDVYLEWPSLSSDVILAAMFCGSAGGFDPDFRTARDYLWAESCPNDGLLGEEEEPTATGSETSSLDSNDDDAERGGFGAVGEYPFPQDQGTRPTPVPNNDDNSQQAQPNPASEPIVNNAMTESTSSSTQRKGSFLLWNLFLLSILTAYAWG